MPYTTLPLLACQQRPESSSGATGDVGRSQSAQLLGKRKVAIDQCNCTSVQTCLLHKAQANFRKSLRRGFLSPLAAQGYEVEHVNPCEARGWHLAGSQVTIRNV